MRIIAISTILLSCKDDLFICKTSCDHVAMKATQGNTMQCNQYQVAIEELVRSDRDFCNKAKVSTSWQYNGRKTFIIDGYASGWSECELSRFHFHNLDGMIFENDPILPATIADTAFVHEMFHMLQGCVSPMPIDDGADSSHSNWIRDGYYMRIDIINSQIRRRLNE